MQTQVVLWDDLSSDVREGATFVVSYFSDVHEIKAIISHCQSVVLLYSSLPVYLLAIGSSPFPNQIRKFTHQKCVRRIRFCIYDTRAAGHRMHTSNPSAREPTLLLVLLRKTARVVFGSRL